MEHHIYLLRPVRPELIDHATAEEEAVLDEHFRYLQAALRDGHLLLAGPCLDGAFGIVVFRAPSAEAALRFMQSDPAVAAGLMSAELHRFRPSLWSGAERTSS